MNNNNPVTNRYFLYVGNAYPHKNLKRLIEAIRLLNQDRTEKILLKIVSAKNAFTRRLADEIKKNDAENYVEILGFVEDGELKKLYRDSVAFVFPSLSEGFGLPGLEAIENGTLLLASNIEVFREIYKENAIYFNQLDFSDIERKMKTALEMDSEEKGIRIKMAKEFIKRYSWKKMAEETLRVYKESVK